MKGLIDDFWHCYKITTWIENGVGGNLLYVNGDKNKNGDGSSWSAAFNNLQSAIQAAVDETDIWVAQGTYTPTTTSGDTTSTFTIGRNNIRLFGGFQGTETSENERNATKYVTILNGTIGMYTVYMATCQ